MKKAVILVVLAALVPLAGCVAPYPYDRYGYYNRGYYGDRYGYRDGDAYYGYNRSYADPRRGSAYRYYDGYDD